MALGKLSIMREAMPAVQRKRRYQTAEDAARLYRRRFMILKTLKLPPRIAKHSEIKSSRPVVNL
jgi:hypothetical protein